MCGIGGFSLSKQSKINPRKLTRALLTEMEARGSMASGYAWESKKASGVYKKDVPGSKLSVWHMPHNARNAILHTRLATHGSASVNANNHPVMSPDGNIALVHNGVIWNHSRVRKELPYTLAEVDTSVIPAVLQKYGHDKFSMLDGDAAVAWMDSNVRNQIKVARISHSPLWVAQGVDGSFFFASTEHILMTALEKLKIDVEWSVDVLERKMFTVSEGVVTNFEDVVALDPAYEEVYSTSYYSNYRHMTAGGRGRSNIWDPTFDNDSWNENPNNNYSSYYHDANGLQDEYNPSFEDMQRWGIKSLSDFKACFQNVAGMYFDNDGNEIGDDYDLEDLYEDFRYHQWQEETYNKEKDLWGRIESWD